MKDVEVDETETQHSPDDIAPWYDQFLKLPEGQRALLVKRAIQMLEETKPEVADFYRRYKCEVVGVQPRVEYALISDEEGGAGDITWVHAFSMPTLLIWSKVLKVGVFVNANLEYNDTVLNRVGGNRKQSLRGFTS